MQTLRSFSSPYFRSVLSFLYTRPRTFIFAELLALFANELRTDWQPGKWNNSSALLRRFTCVHYQEYLASILCCVRRTLNRPSHAAGREMLKCEFSDQPVFLRHKRRLLLLLQTAFKKHDIRFERHGLKTSRMTSLKTMAVCKIAVVVKTMLLAVKNSARK